MASPYLLLRFELLTFGGNPVPWSGTQGFDAQAAYMLDGKVQVRMSDVGAWEVKAPISVAAIPASSVATHSLVPPLGGIVMISLYDVAADSYEYVAAGVIERRTIDWTDNEAPLMTLSGRTTGALLENVVVYPAGGLTAKPVADTRTFGWMSLEYDDSSWGYAKEIVSRSSGGASWILESGLVAPEDFPYDNGTAGPQWIWADNPGGATHSPNSASTSDDTNADVGTCLFRRYWGSAADEQYAFFVTADNYYVLYLDGVEIASNRDDIYGWQKTTRFDAFVSAGSHVIAAKVDNVGGLSNNPGGFLLTFARVDPDGTLHQDSASGYTGRSTDPWTDDGWRVYPYPADDAYPGLTPYRIVDTVLAEALVRDSDNTGVVYALAAGGGTYLGVSNNSTDEAGDAWQLIPEFTVPVGSTALDLLRQLHDQYGCDWSDTAKATVPSVPNVLGIKLWTGTRPPGSTVHTFALGSGVMSLSYEADGA